MKGLAKHPILVCFIVLLCVANCTCTFALHVSERVIYKGFKSDGYKLKAFAKPAVEFDDAVMLVTGPQASSIVRKKEQKFGMWVNSKSQIIPYYYSVIHLYSTRALEELTSKYNIQLLNLHLFDWEQDSELYQIFLQNQFLNNFYLTQTSAFLIDQGVLLEKINLPAQAPVGAYKVHLYLFKDKNLVYAAQTEFTVKNNTIFYRINRAARRHPVLYALVAIFIALGFGWKAAFFFRGRAKGT